MKFSGVLIGSADPERLKGYYTKLFGPPTWEDQAYFGWQFGDAGIMFGPHDRVGGTNREPGRIIWNLEAGRVEEEFAKLKRAGATVVKEPYDPGGNSGTLIATFSDPDNNYFQLMSPVDEEAVRRMQESTAARR